MPIILNKNSGGGTAFKKWNTIAGQLKLDSPNTFTAGEDASFDNFILDAVRKGDIGFIIAGGDGSVNYFLNRCIDLLGRETIRQIKLGAVGIGSSNDFHKSFQHDNNFERIPCKLNFNDAAPRDVGCIKFKAKGKTYKKYFLINASIGITAEGNHFFNNPDFILRYLKRISTQTAIQYTVIKNILTYKNFNVKIEVNNESLTANISNLGIIKSPFFTGKLRFESDPLPDNGLFDVHLYESLSKIKFLKLFTSLSNGKPHRSFNKKFWRTNRVKISSEREFAVEFDGEVIKTKSAEFTVLPRLINVCTN